MLRKASRLLSELEIETVENILIDGYSSSHPDFPCGVCTGCSIAPSKKRTDPDFTIPVLETYDPGRKKVGLRSVDTCSCRICSVMKKNGVGVLLASREKRKRGRPTTKPIHDHIKICSNCFSIIAKGSNHSAAQCKYSKRTKITKLVEISSPTTLQRAASRDRDISDCPVTPLKRTFFHLPTVRVYSKIWVSVTPRQKFNSVISGWQQDLGH